MDGSSDGLRHRLTAETSEGNSNDSLTEEFLCGCCYELMVQPTTLTCGHSFCRLCIASWFLISKKCACPSCRSPWQGNPQINITLRKLIEKMYASTLSERNADTMTEDAKKKIEKFDNEMSTSRHEVANKAQGRGFCSGVFFALAIILFIYLSWYWRSSDQDLLIHKALYRWSVDDVAQWMTDMGMWTDPYVETARQKNIGGTLLMSINEFNIEEIVNVTDPFHKKALLKSLDLIQEKGVKPSSNFWEFKALHPGWALFLLYGLKDNPRSILLYLFMFEYYTMFLPFLQTVSPLTDGQGLLPYNMPGDMTSETITSQWIDFIPTFIFLPYLLIAKYAWQWLDIHFWTSRFILATCLAMTLQECGIIKRIIQGRPLRTFKEEVIRVIKYFISMFIFAIFWPIIPSIICDCFFYVALYFSPYQALEEVYRSL